MSLLIGCIRIQSKHLIRTSILSYGTFFSTHQVLLNPEVIVTTNNTMRFQLALIVATLLLDGVTAKSPIGAALGKIPKAAKGGSKPNKASEPGKQLPSLFPAI